MNQNSPLLLSWGLFFLPRAGFSLRSSRCVKHAHGVHPIGPRGDCFCLGYARAGEEAVLT